tara:strand:+ start:290 stop:475 length:186 start_codon:yes stop_codon:yes gene_type:complete
MVKLGDIIYNTVNIMVKQYSGLKRPILGEKRDKLKEAQKVALDDMTKLDVYIAPELYKNVK